MWHESYSFCRMPSTLYIVQQITSIDDEPCGVFAGISSAQTLLTHGLAARPTKLRVHPVKSSMNLNHVQYVCRYEIGY